MKHPHYQAPKIVIGIPSYDGKMDFRAVNMLMQASTNRFEHTFRFRMSSLLAFTFNGLLCEALAERENGYTHFLLMHADILPEIYFLDKMVDIMRREKCGILSAVVPIKNSSGYTSTAIDTNDWEPSRLTMKQLAKIPPTFTHPQLLINTGLMLVDMRQPWVDDAYFTIRDKVQTVASDGGVLRQVAKCEPEDWFFSRQARRAGCEKICATREVELYHLGSFSYGNNGTWGEEYDTAHGRAPIEEMYGQEYAAPSTKGDLP